MNKSLKKVKAFTLSEMLVVLLITVIVVGLAFSILKLVNNHMFSIQENYEANTEHNLLRQALWIDFNTYHKIHYKEVYRTLSCENERGIVRYYFNQNRVIRERDTFEIAGAKKTLYFKGTARPEGLIDALELSFGKKGGEIFVYKTNDATIHLNNEL